MASNIRDQVRESDDIESEQITVEQWNNVTLEVRSMTGRARARMFKGISNVDSGEVDIEKMYPEIIVNTCYDPETGERVFSEEDVDWLNTKSSGALEKVARVGMRLSGMDRQAETEAGKLSKAEENGDSTSSSLSV